MSKLLLCALAAWPSGCALPSHGYQLHPTAAWSIDATKMSPDRDTSQPDFLLISDTHASVLTAPHELHSNDYIVRGIVKAAIRPPELDQWGVRVLRWLLDNNKQLPVIHLGDAANISCTAEFARFATTMQESGVDWYFAPGNHDSLLMGNFAETVNGDALGAPSWVSTHRATYANTKWGRECGAMPTMDKLDLLAAYRTTKGWTSGTLLDEPQEHAYVCQTIDTSNAKQTTYAVECKYALAGDEANGRDRYRSKGCRNRNEDEHLCAYRAFIVQVVKLAHEWVLLLDTTDLRDVPGLLDSGGVWGGISDKQRAIVEMLYDRHPDLVELPTIIGSHFPIDALDDLSQGNLRAIIEKTRAVAYFGAHAHQPTHPRYHAMSTDDARAFLELNIGSVAAWPMEYLTVGLAPSASNQALTVDVHSAAWTLLAKRNTEGGCKDGNPYAPTSGEYFDYTQYERPQGYQKLVRAMFARERRALASSGLSLADDFELTEVASATHPLEPEIARYERCEAIAASAAQDGSPDHPSAKEPVLLNRHCPSQESVLSSLGFPEDPLAESCIPRLLDVGQPSAGHTWQLSRGSSTLRPAASAKPTAPAALN